MTKFVGTVILVVFAMGANLAEGESSYKGYARAQSIISAQQLKTLLDTHDPKVVVVAVADVFDYHLGHIPGALQAWRADYEAKAGVDYPYSGMVATVSEFEKFARTLGVDNDSTIVVYDHKYDATRLWWAFYLYGKKDVRVLDGGIGAWKAAGYDVDMLSPDAPAPGHFSASVPIEGWSVDDTYIKAGQRSDSIQLWDNREADEWTGEKLMSGAYQKGRIPAARFMNWREFRDEGGLFLGADAMSAKLQRFGFDKAKQQVFYCQSGVRTTQQMFAMYLLGWPVDKLHNFDGSWIAWSYNKANPIVCDNCGDAAVAAVKQ
jgi:thiosulfate/3-mercaptopyruvate sulfurtransferase